MKKLALTVSLRFDGANLVEWMHSKPEAIAYWGIIDRNPGHFPSVMSHLFKVVDLDDGRGPPLARDPPLSHREGTEYFIGCTAVEVALAMMTRDPGYCERVGRLIAGAGDNEDMDVLVQFATFGEVRYS